MAPGSIHGGPPKAQHPVVERAIFVRDENAEYGLVVWLKGEATPIRMSPREVTGLPLRGRLGLRKSFHLRGHLRMSYKFLVTIGLARFVPSWLMPIVEPLDLARLPPWKVPENDDPAPMVLSISRFLRTEDYHELWTPEANHVLIDVGSHQILSNRAKYSFSKHIAIFIREIDEAVALEILTTVFRVRKDEASMVLEGILHAAKEVAPEPTGLSRENPTPPSRDDEFRSLPSTTHPDELSPDVTSDDRDSAPLAEAPHYADTVVSAGGLVEMASLAVGTDEMFENVELPTVAPENLEPRAGDSTPGALDPPSAGGTISEYDLAAPPDEAIFPRTEVDAADGTIAVADLSPADASRVYPVSAGSSELVSAPTINRAEELGSAVLVDNVAGETPIPPPRNLRRRLLAGGFLSAVAVVAGVVLFAQRSQQPVSPVIEVEVDGLLSPRLPAGQDRRTAEEETRASGQKSEPSPVQMPLLPPRDRELESARMRASPCTDDEMWESWSSWFREFLEDEITKDSALGSSVASIVSRFKRQPIKSLSLAQLTEIAGALAESFADQFDVNALSHHQQNRLALARVGWQAIRSGESAKFLRRAQALVIYLVGDLYGLHPPRPPQG